jgi:hypothetical protein
MSFGERPPGSADAATSGQDTGGDERLQKIVITATAATA